MILWTVSDCVYLFVRECYKDETVSMLTVCMGYLWSWPPAVFTKAYWRPPKVDVCDVVHRRKAAEGWWRSVNHWRLTKSRFLRAVAIEGVC